MTHNDLLEISRERLAEYIRQKNMRNTPERYTIMEKALEQKPHFDVDTLFKAIDKEYHVSRTTVYNTIELLCECKILRKHFLNDSQAVYESVDDNHVHLICTRCGAVQDIKDTLTQPMLGNLRCGSFAPAYGTLTIYGVCGKCQRRERRQK